VSKVAFLFPGQGAQRVGMGQSLAAELPAAAELYRRAGDILGYDLARLCFEGPSEQLDSTVHSQPALFVTSLAALEQLRARAPQVCDACQAAAGLSLGEYTALVFAGALDFESGLRLVRQRGAAMQAASDAVRSGMVSVLGPSRDEVAAFCQQARGADVLQVANVLCPGNTVVSGHAEACERLMALAEAAGAKTVRLSVAGAFHTPIMQPAVERLHAALQGVQFRTPRIPVISNVDGQPHTDPAEFPSLLLRQIVEPVRWEDSMRYLLSQGFDTFYELGPGRVLRGLLRRIDRAANCESVE
jgi:[acyl-carrier-protein] S-malonyltransferase